MVRQLDHDHHRGDPISASSGASCANADRRIARLQALDGRVQDAIAKLQAWQRQAPSGGGGAGTTTDATTTG